MDTDVLVGGAGPTGLVVANELRLAGTDAVLVDRLPERSRLSRAGGVQPRTQEALDNLKGREELRDPSSEASDQPAYVDAEHRAIKGEYLVLVGLCTHLGCAPMCRPDVGAQDMGGAEWLGGFFCPCHGSKFDLAGRVYKGVPAPTNLVVPPYSYESDGVVVIGVDQEAG